jgi:asparagine synthetase B (glutamine-hydrolysing)
MCGIAGIFLLDSANKDKLKSIEKMTEALTGFRYLNFHKNLW